MSALWNKFRVLWMTQFAHMAEYRAEILIWMLSGTLTLVMMLVWMAQAAAAPGGQINNYSAPEFAAYFLSTWLVGQLLMVWVSWDLNFNIRMGNLSPQLLRPIDPFWQHLMGHITERFVRLLPMLAILLLFAWLSKAQFTNHWWAYLTASGLIILGFVARFLWEYTIGLLAFWTENTTSFTEVVWLLYAALGGMLAPLSFFPEWVQNIARWTPFPYMLDLPSRLLTGKASLDEFWRGSGVLVVWIIVFTCLRLWVWKTGLKKYGAVGA